MGASDAGLAGEGAFLRRAALITSLGCVLLVSGCGGGTHTQTPPAPAIPRSVGDRLATQSEAVAASLARGDRCAAARQAQALRQAAGSAIAAGRVPAAFQAPLSSAADGLAGRLPLCAPPPPPAPAARGKVHPAEKGKKRDEQKGEHGDGNQGEGGGD